jgi:hypothetical protein
MSNLEYLDHLPKIPEDIMEDIYVSVNTGERYTSQGDTEASAYQCFSSINASDKLKKFTESLFKFEHDTHIFVLSADLPVHMDNLSCRDIAFNYVIQTGGGSTRFHREKTNESVYEEHVIDTHRWHKLDVSKFHSVTIPEPPRILVTVSTLKERLQSSDY